MDFVPLCEPWPVELCCEPSDTVSQPLLDSAQLAASEVLWARSGRQFGSCELLTRPCTRSCLPQPFGGWWWDGVTWPLTTPDAWIEMVCGSCKGACSCGSVSAIRLPGPAQRIVQVLVDGETVPASGYALYGGTTLVRRGGETWPTCQDWTVPVSGTGAWSVTAEYGWPVPELGARAGGELTCEIALACAGSDRCRLPSDVQSVVRQGVSKTFKDPRLLAELRLSGLRLVDLFLQTFNPAGVQGGSQIWDPDDYAPMHIPGRPGGIP